MGVLGLMVQRMDPTFLDAMQMNVLDNLSQLSILWSLAPGASCKGLGIRTGTTVKKLFGISFETLKLGGNLTSTTVLMRQEGTYIRLDDT